MAGGSARLAAVAVIPLAGTVGRVQRGCSAKKRGAAPGAARVQPLVRRPFSEVQRGVQHTPLYPRALHPPIWGGGRTPHCQPDRLSGTTGRTASDRFFPGTCHGGTRSPDSFAPNMKVEIGIPVFALVTVVTERNWPWKP